jgi:methionyl-tRNA formyltransferase
MEVDVKYVILTSEVLEDRFRQEIKNSDLPIENFVFAYNLEQLVSYFKKSSTVKFLISFSTSTIVPKWLINKLNGCAVNIHAASPQYPGRDPHHYAIYDQASEYGATMHYMTEKVDDGIIIDVEFFKVLEPITPLELMYKADESAWLLINKLFSWIKDNEPFPISTYHWGGIKRNRKDFHNFCKIPTDISLEELRKRIKAFHVDGFKNLFVEIHGQKFFL